MKTLNNLDVFMLGTYSESMISSIVSIDNIIELTYELRYINPNYNFDVDKKSLKEWAMFYNCYDENMKSIIVDDDLFHRTKEYEKVARKICNNIYEDFISASQNYHNQKSRCLTK